VNFAVSILSIVCYDLRMSKSKRGSASMSQEKRSAIAKSGGIAAHKKGTAHQFTKEEAIAAGRKGGRSKGKRRG